MVVSISFKEIYTKAIGLFDDPKITVAYENNLVQFCKLMSSFLTTSISLFNNPIVVAEKLSNFKPPQGQTEIFISDGETKTYTLSEEFDLKENSICTYIAKDKIVEGKLDKENKTVTFPDVLPKGEELLFEQYYIGEFVCDFSVDAKPNMQNLIINQIQDIMCRLLVKAWGEEKRNFLLDIQNILNDTDFTLHPASRALESKNAWIKQLDREILQYQNKLAWNIRISNFR